MSLTVFFNKGMANGMEYREENARSIKLSFN